MTTLKTLKLATIIESTNIAPSLVRGIVKWHGGWEEFKAISEDLAAYGANTGQSFVWYTDSVKFFKNHAPELKTWLDEIATDLYSTTIAEMMAKWTLLRGYTEHEINTALYSGKGDARDSVFDVVVKAVTEEIARLVVDATETN